MTIYSINFVRLAVARALLSTRDTEAAIEQVAERLSIPVEAVRQVVDESEAEGSTA